MAGSTRKRPVFPAGPLGALNGIFADRMKPIPTIFRTWTEGAESQLVALFPIVPDDDGSGYVA
jgi:hypothetical protein